MKSLIAIASLFVAAGAFAHNGNVNQQSDDVQVLQAWRGDYIELQRQGCTGNLPPLGQTYVLNCTEQATRLTRAPWANQNSPAATSWELPVYNYNGYIYSRYYAGNVVEVRVVAKLSALQSPTFAGIGFYTRNRIREETLLTYKRDLHVVGQVRLRSGEPAAVLRFLIWMPGEQGDSSTGWSMDSVSFKPFAQFEAPGYTYFNWDVAGDYRIYRAPNGGGTPQVVSIDRQNELLAR